MSPITTTAEAERAIDDLSALIEKLSGLMEQETALVHAGKVSVAVGLGQTKSELARQLYLVRRAAEGEREIFAAIGAGALRGAGARAGRVPRRAAKESDRAGDDACGVGRHHAPAVGRPRAQKRAAGLWRVGTGDGAKSQTRPTARGQPKL